MTQGSGCTALWSVVFRDGACPPVCSSSTRCQGLGGEIYWICCQGQRWWTHAPHKVFFFGRFSDNYDVELRYMSLYCQYCGYNTNISVCIQSSILLRGSFCVELQTVLWFVSNCSKLGWYHWTSVDFIQPLRVIPDSYWFYIPTFKLVNGSKKIKCLNIKSHFYWDNAFTDITIFNFGFLSTLTLPNTHTL